MHGMDRDHDWRAPWGHPTILEAETPREALVLLQGRVLGIWEWLTLCCIL